MQYQKEWEEYLTQNQKLCEQEEILFEKNLKKEQAQLEKKIWENFEYLCKKNQEKAGKPI